MNQKMLMNGQKLNMFEILTLKPDSKKEWIMDLTTIIIREMCISKIYSQIQDVSRVSLCEYGLITFNNFPFKSRYI